MDAEQDAARIPPTTESLELQDRIVGVATRGIFNTINNQSQLDSLAMMVDAYRALGSLAQHPRIDPNRIAVMADEAPSR